MKRSLYYCPWALVILAVFLAVFGWFSESTTVRWVAPAFGLALISVGLGLHSFFIASRTDKRVNELDATLVRIESLQEEIRKEQKEQANSSPPIVASLQAMSQYYMDFLAKQKGEQNNEKS